MLQGKRILLVIAGGIAAYRSLELIRALREQRAAVRCVMTHGAQQFVTPMAAAALSGDRVFTELFSLTDEAEMGHIRLSREADLVVVAPATADLMAKMAAGLADVGEKRVQEALDVIGERGVVWVQGRMVYRSFSGPGGRPGTSAEVLASRIWMERAAATDDNE